MRIPMWFFSSLLVLLSAAWLNAGEWKYVESSSEVGFSEPTFRAQAVALDRPDDLHEDVSYRGTTRRYAVLRYGSPDSRRVTLVVDEVSRNDFDVYVDANRDRIITPAEKIGGAGRLRQFELAAEITGGDAGPQMLGRQVVIRRGLVGSAWSVATLGYVEGEVTIDGRRIRARRVDGDADGLLAGRDRLWLDLDNNGQWDPLAEQFPMLPMLKLHEKRFAVRSDVAGQQLTLQEVSGVGSVRLGLSLLEPQTELISADVMLVGEDGSVISLSGGEQSVEVPVGTYSIGAVRIELKDSGGQYWDFVFSGSDPQRQRRLAIAHGEEVTVDPIGKLDFQIKLKNAADTVASGANLSVQLQLRTEDGLEINFSHCGSEPAEAESDGSAAAIILLSAAGQRLFESRTGFS